MNEYEGLHVYYHAQLKSSLIKGDVLILSFVPFSLCACVAGIMNNIDFVSAVHVSMITDRFQCMHECVCVHVCVCV